MENKKKQQGDHPSITLCEHTNGQFSFDGFTESRGKRRKKASLDPEMQAVLEVLQERAMRPAAPEDSDSAEMEQLSFL